MSDQNRLEYLHEKALKLPLLPGVYLMHDRRDQIIYVGKAKALKNRVSQYFRSVEKHQGKVRKMVEHVYDFETIVTDSEFEALVLECSLIKQHMPKYNILLKDDKGYHYIRITSQEEYPRILPSFQRDLPGDYLGPYISSYAVRNAVNTANEAFLLPTCGRSFPKDFGKSRPCLNYYIKQCMGVCRGNISQEQYGEILEEAVEFLRSGRLDNVQELTDKMNQAAERMEFEKAAKYRDRIRSMQKITEKQKVINSRIPEQDIFAFVQNADKIGAAVLHFRHATLVDKEDFVLEAGTPLPSVRSEFLMQYYSNSGDIPPYIALDDETEDQQLVEDFLTQRRGKRARLFVPQRGQQQKLVQMAGTNAAERLSLETQRTGREVAALDELGRLLGLVSPPVYIEAYDISHFSGDNIVGGMVVFENGRPLKSNYRKFALKTVTSPDDYAAMREVLERRLNRYFEEKDTDSAFGRLPDLILLDGGKGQVSAVLPVLEKTGLEIPLFGMVKDQKHKTRAIAKNGGEIAIAGYKSAFTLVTKIQDEVHRFAVAYQHNRQRASTFSSLLEKIPGVGPATAQKLMKKFGTLEKVKKAQKEQLMEIPGLSETVAEHILAFFAEEE